MFIEVTGGTKQQRTYAESLASFCVKMLMPRMRSLEIDIKLCKPKSALGYCLELDTNREFELEIDKTQPMRRMLETVAHEMVHVKQFARRELHPSTDEWYGKTYNPKKVSYWDLPWEIEAHGREVGLFIRWCEQENLSSKKWSQV